MSACTVSPPVSRPTAGRLRSKLHGGGASRGTTCGKHYSAGDLVDCTTQGCAYQAKGVAYTDGSKRDFGRRERPHMVWAMRRNLSEAPVPLALSTAVTAMPTCETLITTSSLVTTHSLSRG